MGIAMNCSSIVFVFLSWSMLVFSQQSSTQKSIMLNLFHFLHNPKNYDFSYFYFKPPKWNASPNPCRWEGVICTNNSVTQLHLTYSDNYIRNSSVISIACQIQSLQVLDVSNNYLGSIPDEFITRCGKLPRLKSVDFSRNYISGNLPCFNKGGFTSLESLDLSDNSFYDSIGAQFDGLVALKRLKFSSSNLTGSIPSNFLKKLKGLKELDLSYNSLQGRVPDQLANCNNLTHLDLSNNQLSGNIPDVLKAISYLNLASNYLSGGIPSQLGSGRLMYLDVSFNYLSGPIPTTVQKFGYEAFAGNYYLCGYPVLYRCDLGGGEDASSFYLGLYVSMGLGFYFGFWGVCGTLVLKHSWRYAFFNFIDTVYNRIYVTIAIYVARFQRKSLT